MAPSSPHTLSAEPPDGGDSASFRNSSTLDLARTLSEHLTEAFGDSPWPAEAQDCAIAREIVRRLESA
jgi:hypothetical protein